ncbi:MAG: phosphatase [Clostridia bacterium]|nr:phosphatase [Clostridia bacterium]
MTPEAREARKAYKREWAKKNPDKIRQYQETFWNKKAQEAAAAAKAYTGTETEEGKQEN